MAETYPTSPVAPTGITRLDALTHFAKWGGPVGTGVALTYSFHNAASSYGTLESYGHPAPFADLAEPTEAVKAAIRQALADWSKVANITFTEVADTGVSNGILRFGLSGWVPDGVAGDTLFPESHERGGDVWLSPKSYGNLASLTPGNFNYHVLIHEIGHAIGLTHPFDTDVTLSAAENNVRFTSMSYTVDRSWFGTDPDTGLQTLLTESTPMLYDIAVAQYLYGANTTTNTGNDTYAFDPARATFLSIWDAGGTDTLDATRFVTPVTINLNPGTFSSIASPPPAETLPAPGQVAGQAVGNIAIAFGTIIENVQGGGNGDIIIGNAVGNIIEGRGGNDQLYGFAAGDYLVGGGGDDMLNGGDDMLNGSESVDIALLGDGSTPVTVDLNLGLAISSTTGRDALVSVEGAAGTEANDTFVGNDFNNAFFGGPGDDSFVFTTGTDYLEGGADIDTVFGLGLRQDHTLSFSGDDGHIDDTTARSIERFEFADGRLETGIQDTAAQVYRLYHAALDRDPDSDGLKTWNDALEAGTSLQTVADGITGSAEFQIHYGILDNPQFVTMLYGSALDRAPDAEGMANWLNALNAGASRSQVVLDISESAEHVEKTRSGVEAGLWLEHDLVAAPTPDTSTDRLSDASQVELAGAPDHETPVYDAVLGVAEPQDHQIAMSQFAADSVWFA
jgi:serralysin